MRAKGTNLVLIIRSVERTDRIRCASPADNADGSLISRATALAPLS